MSTHSKNIIPSVLGAFGIAVPAGLVALDLYLSPLPGRPGQAQGEPVEAREEAPAATETVKEDEDVEHYVLFREEPFGDDAIVTTGTQFANTRASTPEEQWCYVVRNSGDGGALRKVSLARRTADGANKTEPVTRKAADDIGYSLKDLEQARELCRFMEPGEERDVVAAELDKTPDAG